MVIHDGRSLTERFYI